MRNVIKAFAVYDYDDLSREAQETVKYRFLCSKREDHMDVLYSRFVSELKQIFPDIIVDNVCIELYPTGTCDIDFRVMPDDIFSFMEGKCDTSTFSGSNQHVIERLEPFADSDKDIIRGYLKARDSYFDSVDIDKGSYGFWTTTDYLENVFGLSLDDYGFRTTDYDAHILDDFQYDVERIYDILSDHLEEMAYDYIDSLDSHDMSIIRQMSYLHNGDVFDESEFDRIYGESQIYV